jgi:regulation of enolase protein 1 (concanavalin A-like superfamily)
MAPTTHLPFHTLHIPGTTAPPSAASTSFSLSPVASTPTDIWRKPGPPAIKTFNAPIIYKSLSLHSFQRVSVTISASWSQLYDQGGLVFIIPTAGMDPVDHKWIKTGIEFYQGEPYVSTVAADRWADWSLLQAGIKDGKVTLEIERNTKEGTLWIYIIDGRKRIPIREVTWALSEPETSDCWVGVYAATPTIIEREGSESANAKGHLDVRFEAWELEVTESKITSSEA